MVNILLTKKPCCIQVDVTGHAGYAEEGKDIVCASVSILVHSLAQTIEDMASSGWLEKKEVNLEKGRSSVLAVSRADCEGWMLLGTYSIIAGFRLLSANYQEYVTYSENGEDSST